MEIELKFLVEEQIVRDRILDDKHLCEIMTPDSEETLQMKAVYYDTESKALCGKTMAFRVRAENEKYIATLKWGGGANDGLHVRSELNIIVDESFMEHPTTEIFRESEIFEEIEAVTKGEKLQPVMTMEYIRKQIQVDTGKSISVVSMDEGSIITSRGTEPISELEIELYSGDQEDMIELGKELEQKYNLIPGNKSKYQRGIELLLQQ